MTFPTRRRVGDVIYTASRRSTATSPKPLTDKLDKKQTSCKDKQTSQEKTDKPGTCSRPLPTGLIVFVGQYLESGSRIMIHITPYKPFLTGLIVFVSRYLEWGSRVMIHITLYKPPSTVMCHLFHTSKMTGTHQEKMIDHLRVLLFFIELNLFYML